MIEGRSAADGGLPASYAFSALVYSPISSILIATVETQDENGPRCRLFWRRAAAADYRELGGPVAPEISRRDVVVASDRPLGYFCEYVLEPTGWNWRALMRVDFDTMKVAEVFNATRLGRNGIRRWLAGLVSADSQGQTVCCVVGKEEPDGVGGTNATYDLCALSVSSGDTDVITRLEWLYL